MTAQSRPARRRSGCPVSIGLEMIGDSWSLLIVRDLLFGGPRAFNDFLASGEGIASNILADRLQKLEAAGILTRQQNPRDARRFTYRLTEMGIDLAPLLIDLILWSARYARTDAPAATLRRMRTHRTRFLASLRRQWTATRAEHT